MGNFGNFLDDYLIWIMLGVVALVVLAIGFWVLSAIARVGTIRALDELQDPTRPATFSFSKVWTEGKQKFFVILKIDILIGLAMLLIFLALATPVVALAVQDKSGGAILLGLLATVLFIPLVLLSSFMKKIAVVMCALSEVPATKAIESSYRYVVKNIKEALKLLLAMIVFSLLLSLASFVALAPAALIGFGLAISSGGSLGTWPLFGAAIATGIIAAAIAFLLKAFFSVWLFDIWLWWIKKIGGAKINAKGEEKEYAEQSVRGAVPETEG